MNKTSFRLQSVHVVLITVVAFALSFFVLKNNIFYSIFGQAASNNLVSVVIVPHHDLVSSQRNETLRQVADRIEPKTIILVSPNHFNTGSYDALITNRQWRLVNSYLESDQEKIRQLNIALDDVAFNREHGITNLLEPIKINFPDAKIIPIILKQNMTEESLNNLADKLNQICSKDCLMVSSIDFSHYQPASVASVHDQFSIKVLSNGQPNLSWLTEVDSNPSVYMSIKWANLRKTNSFNLFANTNSGFLEKSPDAESTSYVFGWFEQGKPQLNDSQTFVAGFDLEKVEDKRLISGVDQKIDLNNNHEMAMTCINNGNYCALNRLLWGPNFYRDLLGGLIIEGEIYQDKYKIVLVPTDPISHRLLVGEDKLQKINQIRKRLNLAEVSIDDGYDTIVIDI